MLKILGDRSGYSVIEVLIVAGVISLTAVMSGMLTSKFFMSRAIDDITQNITSTVQVAKMKSARQGVEYRAVFAKCADLDNSDLDCPVCNNYDDYQAGDPTVTFTIERGDSNKGSTTWCVESTQSKKVSNQMDMDLTDMSENDPYRLGFNPSGFVVDSTGTPIVGVETMSIHPSLTADVKRCGSVELSSLGRISVIQGNWDGTICNPIREPISTPPPELFRSLM